MLNFIYFPLVLLHPNFVKDISLYSGNVLHMQIVSKHIAIVEEFIKI